MVRYSHISKSRLGAQALTLPSDRNDISSLPAWVKIPKQITDVHLVQLARANDGVLATLDEGIPGAFLIL
jgi:hypothetical protein